mgnify:CR=1 FL=1
MGNILSNEKNFILVNFEYLIGNNDYILINTLPLNNQSCLIVKTIDSNNEEKYINELLNNDINKNIVIYGKNCSDISTLSKFKQLKNLGFKNIKIYMGGLFEWLLLQDIYGDDKFQTISKEIDILKYR